MKTLQLSAQINGVSTKVDGSLSIRISTQELTSEAKAEVMEYTNLQGWLLFRPDTLGKFDEVDVPKENSSFDESKSPSQRLRGTLFVLWQQRGEKEDFNLWYRKQIEKIIESIKTKLE